MDKHKEDIKKIRARFGDQFTDNIRHHRIHCSQCKDASFDDACAHLAEQVAKKDPADAAESLIQRGL